MKLAPWEYLFRQFTDFNFPDTFHWTWIASLGLLLAMAILYAVRTRQLHRHQPYLDLYEWLLWTAVIGFGLIAVYTIFHFYFVFVLATVIATLGTLAWVRFVKFPPQLEAYQRSLARQRYFTRSKYAHPEATIRTKRGKRRRG